MARPKRAARKLAARADRMQATHRDGRSTIHFHFDH
jgi:hypothetical protein